LRIVAELEALQARHRRSRHGFACVSHADPIKLALAHYLGLPLDLFQRLMIDPASVSVVLLDESGARVARMNDTRAAEVKTSG
jgi:probable phosphoglycerate mutase